MAPVTIQKNIKYNYRYIITYDISVECKYSPMIQKTIFIT